MPSRPQINILIESLSWSVLGVICLIQNMQTTNDVLKIQTTNDIFKRYITKYSFIVCMFWDVCFWYMWASETYPSFILTCMCCFTEVAKLLKIKSEFSKWIPPKRQLGWINTFKIKLEFWKWIPPKGQLGWIKTLKSSLISENGFPRRGNRVEGKLLYYIIL